MEDMDIIELYWQRNERAIEESDKKYGGLCSSVAYRVLGSPEDCEECVSDTWLKAWSVIPPERPSILKAFFAKITRNLALDRLRRSTAQKRGGGETTLALEELQDCVSGKPIEHELERRLLEETLEAFLRELEERERELFLRRYWCMEPVGELAARLGMSRKAATMKLYRLRLKLRECLEKEGVAV